MRGARGRCIAILLLLEGCLAENPDFLGEGFFDEVESDGPSHPVWNVPSPSSWWQRGECSPEHADDGNWRFGAPDSCATGPNADDTIGSTLGAVVLTTRAIPVAGRVTLEFSTRVSLPACGLFALSGGRVNALVGGVSQTLAFDVGQRDSLFGGSPLFAGELDWTRAEATFETSASTVSIVFGFMGPPEGCLAPGTADDPCVPKPEAPPECAMTLACCSSAYDDGSSYSGWQIDDVRLTIEP